MDCSRPGPLSSTVSRSLLKRMSTESVMPSKHLILCSPLLLLPSVSPSIRVFSCEVALHIRWAKVLELQLPSISPSNEYSWLISFRILCFDLLAVQGTPKSLLQHHSSKHPVLFKIDLYIFKEKEHCRGPASAGSRGYPRDERCRREREKTRETSLDRAKSARERERERKRERERMTRPDSELQNLAILRFFTIAFIP